MSVYRRGAAGISGESAHKAVVGISGRPDAAIGYAVHSRSKREVPLDAMLRGPCSLELVENAGYPMVRWLMGRSHFIITDPGGIQAKVSFLGCPVLVAQEVTERPETIETEVARALGTDPARTVNCARTFLDDVVWYDDMARSGRPFLSGHRRAAAKAVEALGLFRCESPVGGLVRYGGRESS